jgi:His-Xaa-Ser system protein HxsD
VSSSSSGDPGDIIAPAIDLAIEDRTARLQIDTAVYSLVAVQKTAYRLANRFTVAFASTEAGAIALTFTFLQGTTESAARELLRLFFQELLDQQLREKLAGETRAVRALLLAQAFSRTDLIRGD